MRTSPRLPGRVWGPPAVTGMGEMWPIGLGQGGERVFCDFSFDHGGDSPNFPGVHKFPRVWGPSEPKSGKVLGKAGQIGYSDLNVP